DEFRDALAAASGRRRERVGLHAVHQHDAPVFDPSTAAVLRRHGVDPGPYAAEPLRPVIERIAATVRAAATNTRPVTAVGWGRAEVFQVASNRRIPGPDGRVRATRYTATADPALRAEPEGVIDPYVALVSFWDGDRPLAVLSHYATHPQSYYRTGIAHPDFPGIARFLRDQSLPGVTHVHFNGAGGNIGAGKYNDGSPTNRAVLAGRLADGIARAWAATQCRPLAVGDAAWVVERVKLPRAPHLDRPALEAQVRAATPMRHAAAAALAWLERGEAAPETEISCLRLGDVRLLHLPGELFVEYQLAAQRMRPDLRVALAAYGDYGPAYIGTARAYGEGGYETEPRSSFVAPEVEEVLLGTLRRLLAAE
ncbi:MAG TPA: hypothetical protein PKE47_17565, partial [Verrucomicrobiota bacterium]|nr:hypothetical protein [Verrucomicrobiota bacterium]